MNSPIERMKKGGRLDPKLPHAFVPMPSATTEDIGGRAVPSRSCGACGGSRDLALHTDGGDDSQASIRERQGPFGQ